MVDSQCNERFSLELLPRRKIFCPEALNVKIDRKKLVILTFWERVSEIEGVPKKAIGEKQCALLTLYKNK